MHVVFLDALHDLTQGGTYAWGVAALVHMYDNLNEASKSMTRQLAGAARPTSLSWPHASFAALATWSASWIGFAITRSLRVASLCSLLHGSKFQSPTCEKFESLLEQGVIDKKGFDM